MTLNEALLVAGQCDVIKVVIVTHLLQVVDDVRWKVVPLEDKAVLMIRASGGTPHCIFVTVNQMKQNQIRKPNFAKKSSVPICDP